MQSSSASSSAMARRETPRTMFWPQREVIGSMTVFCAQKNAASPVV
jgi:hypothetical protein